MGSDFYGPNTHPEAWGISPPDSWVDWHQLFHQYWFQFFKGEHFREKQTKKTHQTLHNRWSKVPQCHIMFLNVSVTVAGLSSQRLPSVLSYTPKMDPWKSAAPSMWPLYWWHSLCKAKLSSIFYWPAALSTVPGVSAALLSWVGCILPLSTLHLASERATVTTYHNRVAQSSPQPKVTPWSLLHIGESARNVAFL